jgi:hypothetical protein
MSMTNVRVGNYGLRAILLMIAVVLFVLAGLGIGGLGPLGLEALGLAAFAGAFLVAEL